MKQTSTHIPIKTMTRLALFIAIALTIFVLENQIPIPIAIPGVKLGLANIVTLYLINQYSPKQALFVLIARIVLGSIFAGQMMSFLYSLVGGLLSLLIMSLINHIQKRKNVWFTSILGGISHNIGQFIVAMLVMKSSTIMYYFAPLGICGIVTGLFTGLVVQMFISKMKNQK